LIVFHFLIKLFFPYSSRSRFIISFPKRSRRK